MFPESLLNIFNLKENEIVTWEDLCKAPANVWVDLSEKKSFEEDEELQGGVYFKKLETKVPNQMIFITRIFKGFGYHYHMHDCKETCTAISGSFIVNDNKVIKNKESITFQRNTSHKVYYESGKDFCEVFVEFNKY